MPEPRTTGSHPHTSGLNYFRIIQCNNYNFSNKEEAVTGNFVKRMNKVGVEIHH
jgi:hypothetical protein